MFTKEDIIKTFEKPELKTGLEKYIEIMECFDKTDVSTDKDFQRLYNHFYRMRQRKPEFYQSYYGYMEKMKNHSKTLTFEDVLFSIQEETGRCEASFSSKLLATLNPDMPVWDMFVLENLGIKQINASAKNREQKIIDAYNQTCKWYNDFLNTEDANLIVKIFDEMFPDVCITNVKKIDMFLWQHREINHIKN